METFYFGRLNYTSKHRLYDLLTYGNKFRFKKKGTRFGIFNVETIEDAELGVVFTGELVKYQDLKEEPVVKENELTIEYIEDVILGRCRFYLLEKTHLIAYNPYGNIISPSAFCDAFSGVIIGADDSFNVDSEIYPINQEYEFLKELKLMKSLKKIVIKLTPSNPNNRPLWRKYDERYQKLNLKTYKEEMIAKEGRSIDVDEESESKIAMAMDGYGKAEGEGEDKDGMNVKISTDQKESIVKKRIEKNLTPSLQLASLKGIFNSVIDRFKK